jgi:hypothetical protein
MSMPTSDPSAPARGPFRCGNPQIYGNIGPGPCKRDAPHVTFAVVPGFAVPGLDRESCRAQMRAALQAWAAVSGITWDEHDGDNGASIVVAPGAQPQGVIASCGMPCNGIPDSMTMPLTVNTLPQNLTNADFACALIHEVGHGLGLQHCAEGSGIMGPVLDPSHAAPYGTDLGEIQSRYGPPSPTPVPPTPVPPPPKPAAPRMRGYVPKDPVKTPRPFVVYLKGPDGKEVGYRYLGVFRPGASNPNSLLFDGPAQLIVPPAAADPTEER